MSSCVTRAAVLCTLALACSLPARSQSGNEGSIEGIVMDASGATVPGAAVKLRQQERGASLAHLVWFRRIQASPHSALPLQPQAHGSFNSPLSLYSDALVGELKKSV